jgi:tetratricopeptide (TPR) repeat protein
MCGDVARVEAICAAHLEADPDDGFLHSVLADAYWRSGQNAEALKAASRVLQCEPDNFEALCISAGTSFELGRHGDALEFANRMIAARPILDSLIFRLIIFLKLPFIWVPRFRRMRMIIIQERQSTKAWLEWAREYVSSREVGNNAR